MVAVAVGDEDQVDLAELGEVLVFGRRLGISLQVGVDDDRLAARRGDLERGVTEPEHLDLPGLGQKLRARQREGQRDDERPAQHDEVATMQGHGSVSFRTVVPVIRAGRPGAGTTLPCIPSRTLTTFSARRTDLHSLGRALTIAEPSAIAPRIVDSAGPGTAL